MSDDYMQVSERVRGKSVGFERIRRITGYLVGTLDRFNNGKRAEEHDRVKHSLDTPVDIEVVNVSGLETVQEQETTAVGA